MLATNSVSSIEVAKREKLQTFITTFIEGVKENKLQMEKWGIKNMNLALLNIDASAFTFYPNMQEKAKEWYDENS